MANLAGEVITSTSRGATSRYNLRAGSLSPLSAGVTTFTTYYKMIGQDHNTNSTDTWRVTGSADPNGAHYSGGLTTPLRNIHIADTWTK